MLRVLVLVLAAVTASLLAVPHPADAQQAPSATRSFSASSVEVGGQVVVTIAVANYGGIGQLTESFPDGLDFVSSNPSATRSGRNLTFNLVGDSSVSYTLTAATAGRKSGFSGTLSPATGSSVSVRGASSVNVTSPPAPTLSATRSISPTSVEVGGQVVVTIAVANYGGIGQLTESFPDGLDFVSSNPSATRSGRNLTFNLVGDSSVSYTLTAATAGRKSGFSGTLSPATGSSVSVRGASSVNVTSPPPGSTPSATRSFSPSSVQIDSQLVVTIAVANYGGIGQLTESYPSDFSFVSSNPSATRSPSDGSLTFNLVGDSSVSYTLTAPPIAGTQSGFSGSLAPADAASVSVRGPSSIRVTDPGSGGGGTPSNRAPIFSEGSSASRSVAENSAPGTAVGAPVTATDRDRDRITYSLSGTDASSFSVDSSNGQISVGQGTSLDFETKSSYAVTVQASDPSRRSDTISITIRVTNVDEDGEVTLSAEQPEIGTEMTATLTDPDGSVSGATWTWDRSTDMTTWTEASAATSTSAYTPTEADAGNYLRATATYDDASGSDRTASAVTANAVRVHRYDINGNGVIDVGEAIKAIQDYFSFEISDTEVLRVVQLYFAGLS